MYLFTDNEIQNIMYELNDAGDIFKLLYYVKERMENNPESGETKKAKSLAINELNGYIYDMEEGYIENQEDFDIDITTPEDWEPKYKSVTGLVPQYILGVDNLDNILNDVSLSTLKSYFDINDWNESDSILKKMLVDHPKDLILSEPDLEAARVDEYY